MSYLGSISATAVIGVLLVRSPSVAMEPGPQMTPTRDVDITYTLVRPHQPPITERVRWSASEHLERIDGPNRSTSIFDRVAKEITLLNSANRTYRKLEGAPRLPIDPEPGALFRRGADAHVAGLRCTEWSWTQETETRIACATPDGVLLRLVVDGKTAVEARSVSYSPQRAELFQVPPDYTPALAPEGITGSP